MNDANNLARRIEEFAEQWGGGRAAAAPAVERWRTRRRERMEEFLTEWRSGGRRRIFDALAGLFRPPAPRVELPAGASP